MTRLPLGFVVFPLTDIENIVFRRIILHSAAKMAFTLIRS